MDDFGYVEEEKKERPYLNGLLWFLCIAFLVGSTVGILWTGIAAEENKEFRAMNYDRESHIITANEKITRDIMVWYWVGSGAAIVTFAYAILRDIPNWKKVAGGIVSVLLLVGNMLINGTIASFAFVDVGIGMMPQCHLSEEGGGEFVRATHKIDSTVAVFFILGDKAYRVDGYDPAEGERTYEAIQEKDVVLNPWQILVYEEGDDYPWGVLVYEDNEEYRYFTGLDR